MKIDFSLRNVSKDKEEKYGRYSQTMHWDVKDFGKKKWVVIGYIDINWPSLCETGMSKQEIINSCLEELNKIPERKKYQKKESRPLYGHLEQYRAAFIEHAEKPCIIYEFITNDANNSFFIGDPPST